MHFHSFYCRSGPKKHFKKSKNLGLKLWMGGGLFCTVGIRIPFTTWNPTRVQGGCTTHSQVLRSKWSNSFLLVHFNCYMFSFHFMHPWMRSHSTLINISNIEAKMLSRQSNTFPTSRNCEPSCMDIEGGWKCICNEPRENIRMFCAVYQRKGLKIYSIWMNIFWKVLIELREAGVCKLAANVNKRGKIL
jgi:hypothetical protein